MKHTVRLIILLLIPIFLVSCASKRYAKKAQEFEAAGLYSDAANYYYQSVVKNDKNVTAKLGLYKNGQIVLDEKINEFKADYQNARYQDAVNDYQEIQQYIKKLGATGVKLNYDESISEYYDESKDFYLDKEYKNAMEALNKEEFAEAEKLFAKIIRIQASYRDVPEKYDIARFEPLYRQGQSQMQQQHYRSAYYTFAKIINASSSDYKQAKALSDDAFERASIPVLILPTSVPNRSYISEGNQLTQGITNGLKQSKNPFVKVLDPAALPAEIFDANGRVKTEAAQIYGIKVILTVDLQSAGTKEGKPVTTKQKAYLKTVTKKKNAEGEEYSEVKYSKVNYLQTYIKNEAYLSLSYKFINIADGSVIGANSYSKSVTDEVTYGTYNGNYKSLVPGSWEKSNVKSSSDKVEDNDYAIRQLRTLFTANKKPQTTGQLVNILRSDIQSQIRTVMDKYAPEK